jgi:hypothetical protein
MKYKQKKDKIQRLKGKRCVLHVPAMQRAEALTCNACTMKFRWELCISA